MPAQRRVQLGIPLSLNHATQQDLRTIPKLRKQIAARIVAYRNKHGAFRQLDELLHIKGIGPKTLRALRPYLTLIDPSDRTRHRKKETSAMP
jgi:competence protein ComEA